VVRVRPDWDESATLVARTSEAGALPAQGTRVALSVRGSVIAWADLAAPGDADLPAPKAADLAAPGDADLGISAQIRRSRI